MSKPLVWLKKYWPLAIALVSICVVSSSTHAAFKDEIAKNTSPSVKWLLSRANACLNANNITRINANGECLALQTYFPNIMPKPHPVLLVFIHGDGIPGGAPSDYLKFQATKFVAPNVVPVVLIRPGYYDSYGHYSTGESYALNTDGYPNDSYHPHTVATIAASVKKLRDFYQARCTILIGHSGGGIMLGIILGKYPGLANGAVMASVVGNVHSWAKKHKWGSYPNSLSPNNFVTTIPKNDFIHIISGTKDADTYPNMSKAYYNLLKLNGIHAHWYSVKGGTHNSVVLSNTAAFDSAIKAAISSCKEIAIH